ncbi:MAG TPA: hypothetical protein EYQ53_06030 [Candidatus Poseidoniales archaeon]|jgi:tRNA pseudouridine-54 N-methylase|nr:MAG: hypothetical protein CXT69_04170 [Euryarchaeota archaeon]HIG03918.1 hypothetical protein [Candidatus Poseidoniales archaeon]HIK77829.1 hypothetical protein [Candidatus Poseidoniales archaeon]
MIERRFAIVGHRAPSKGKVNLNDLSGSSGRIDVLCRAVNTALFLSHGMRKNTHITLHLMGGPGMGRRIWFDSRSLRGIRVDERSIAGHISKIIQQRAPAIGQWEEFSQGLWHSPGGLLDTLKEWSNEGVEIIHLDVNAPTLWADEAHLPSTNEMKNLSNIELGGEVQLLDGEGNGENETDIEMSVDSSIGFILSDDQLFNQSEINSISEHADKSGSLGPTWIQGHSAIAIIHQLLDLGIKLR